MDTATTRLRFGLLADNAKIWAATRFVVNIWLLWSLAAPTSAQLDEECTITVNGQSVRGRQDGSFLIQNVPAGNALVRATATCIQGGVTLYGTSQFFYVEDNETFTVERVLFSPAPIQSVVSLRSMASPTLITEPLGSAQVFAMALFSDGFTEGADGLGAGSTYTSSNPDILTVNEDGLVTAAPEARGTALIAIVNQGATSVVAIAVSPGDPLTSVEGFVVLEDESPVEGAMVTLPGLSGMDVTDPDGHFCIGCEGPGVPTELGPLSVLAQAVVGGMELNAFRIGIAPQPREVTDAGVLVLKPCVAASDLAVGWWRLGETSGTTSSDAIEGHDGVYVGDPVPAPGLVGGALDFDGNDYVSVPDDALWHLGTSDFTIEFWAQFDTTGSGSVGGPGDVFVGNDEGGGTTNKWFFALGGGRLNFHVNGPFSSFFPQVPFTPMIGDWYHLAIVREGTLFTIYVNGIAQSPTATESRAIPDASASLTLGWAEGFGFDGRLDEMTFYRRALSPEVLRAIYLAREAGKCLD